MISKIKKSEENLKLLTKGLEGWLSDSEAELLYNLAKKCRGEGVIVEIGSWKGKSTICLGLGSKKGKYVKIYAVDPHTGSSEHLKNDKAIWTFEEFKRNISKANLEDIVTPIVKTSEEAAQDFLYPIEFIFIDGAHELEYVEKDFDLWYPKIVDGGYMAFHDTLAWDGPRIVVEKNLYRSKNFKDIKFTDSITYGKKTKHISLEDRINNEYSLILRKIYIYLANKKFPPILKKAGRKLLRVVQISLWW